MLKDTKSLSSLGLAKFLTEAAHQSVYILSVFSFLIRSFGLGSIKRQRACKVSLTAIGGLDIVLNSVILFLSKTSKAFYAAFNLGSAIANYFSHYYLIELA